MVPVEMPLPFFPCNMTQLWWDCSLTVCREQVSVQYSSTWDIGKCSSIRSQCLLSHYSTRYQYLVNEIGVVYWYTCSHSTGVQRTPSFIVVHLVHGA